MKNTFKIFILILLCFTQTGCFVIRQTSSEQPKEATTMSQILVRHWRFQEAYNMTDSKPYDIVSNNSYWFEFNSDGTCYENGFLGTGGGERLLWYLSGNTLRIRGKKLVYGELYGSEVVYTIEHLSKNKLHLSRWNGRKKNGKDVIRLMIFTY